MTVDGSEQFAKGKPRTITFSIRYFIAVAIALVATLVCLISLVALLAHRKIKFSQTPDIFTLTRNWGQSSPYKDNAADAFGVNNVNLRDGCRITQLHVLQRSGERFPENYSGEGGLHQGFARKLNARKSQNFSRHFVDSLAFLNGYNYELSNTGALTRIGAATEFQRGAAIWNNYGRELLQDDQLPITPAMKPFVRTTSSNHVAMSVPYWLAGFFGVPPPAATKFDITPAPTHFDFLLLEENDNLNNTLAPWANCPNSDTPPIYELGDLVAENFIPVYLQQAVKRLQPSTPPEFNLNTTDLYAMQSICAFETNAFGVSPFCSLFTPSEWEGFEQTYDQEYYYDSAFGNPTGRAQGIGYLQELLSRLTQHYITVSNSTTNVTLDDDPSDFPLHRKVYVDFTHSNTIVSVLTAMSLDYFRDPPGMGTYPVTLDKRFSVAAMTPAGANLVVEVITCDDVDSEAVLHADSGSSLTEADNAGPYPFIRMRLNNGILPLDSIRGGACQGSTDGLCPLEKFLASQSSAYEDSNFDFACFGQYVKTESDVDALALGKDWDGTIDEGEWP